MVDTSPAGDGGYSADDAEGGAGGSDEEVGGVAIRLPGEERRPRLVGKEEEGQDGWARASAELVAKRKEGQRRAEERELVRCVARRAVAFGLVVGAERKRCEAVQRGLVAEASAVKGEWGVRLVG
jgi:hypothetical protein